MAMDELLNEVPCTPPKYVLRTLASNIKPWSVPYHVEQHGRSLEAFQKHPDQFDLFKNKYYALVDQLPRLAANLGISAAGLQALDKQLHSFKEHLFDLSYCDARPNILWNSAREQLEMLVLLLQQPTISAEKRLEVVSNLRFNMPLCSDGIVSYLQDSIQTLVSDGDIVPRAEEILVKRLVFEFVRDNHLCPPDMVEHYINELFNYFAYDLDLNQWLYEQIVTPDTLLIKQHAAACRQMLTKKLPLALVSYLSEKLCSAGRQALQKGQIEGESWQYFVESPLVKFFTSNGITQALFVPDKQGGRYAVPTDPRALHWRVARHLMDQGWLQPQEPRHLMAQAGGALYTLADNWFYWQSEESSDVQRPMTAEELLKLLDQITSSQPEQLTPLPPIVLRLLELAAEQGSAEAQLKLGLIYLNGQGVDKNIQKAFRYFQLAADQEYTEAQFNLGLMHLDGQGSNKNEQKGCQFLTLAAESGHQKALESLRSAALKLKNAEAQFNLGMLYLHGKGVADDKSKAFEFFELAAVKNHTEAQFNLGMMYLKNLVATKVIRAYGCYQRPRMVTRKIKFTRWHLSCQRVAQDKKKDLQFLKSDAGKEHTEAQFNLGLMYKNGLGVDKNPEEAFQLLTVVAKRGHLEALDMLKSEIENENPQVLFNLGVMYFTGQGVDKNEEEALKIFKSLAKDGNAQARFYLGVIYFNG